MPLPDSYTIKVGAIPAYIEAMLAAEAPDRFSIKFLESLEFTSTNDRLWIGILKELGFLNTDGVPTERYYQFLDRSQAPHVLAEGIKEAYADLFAVNKEAQKLDANEAFNKLRTLYKGEKKDTVIKNIAKTFVGLCDAADFSKSKKASGSDEKKSEEKDKLPESKKVEHPKGETSIGLDSLQYHINIVLPDTRDQAVYDAIFKSLRDHLG
jgi:hypothetical protein